MKTWREECGVFGIWNNPEASRLAYLGLYALQHRGQESAGITSLNEGVHLHHKGQGLVADVFTETDLDRLKGLAAVGHNRYSTTGENLLTNAQPLTAQLKSGPIAVAHNGNIVNAGELRESLQREGAIFQGSNDTECLLHLLARHNGGDIIDAIQASVQKLVGAYSFSVLTHDKLIAIRDPYGFRPLALGKIGESTVIASETCAFDLIGAKCVREIEPGEIFWVDSKGEHSKKFSEKKVSEQARCIFEHVYFSRPDSIVFNHSVYESRKKMGAELARENKVDADIVIPVPDSGVPASIGYAAESGIPLEFGIIRNHYVGRTFIEPRSSIRSFGVKIKLNPQSAVLAGKKVIVIDDSLVRGTTSRKIIGLIRQAGAKEVHLRIAAPPTISPCYYGVDTPTKTELIASQMSVNEIKNFVEADSLAYLSLDGLHRAVGESQGFCSACFDNKYPTPLFGREKG